MKPRKTLIKGSAKDRAGERLLKSVAYYVKIHGGNVAVAGHVHVIKWPQDLEFNWTLGIKCTGSPPKAKELA
jgi:hypothetical protein